MTHLSPLWGLGARDFGFLYTYRPSGALQVGHDAGFTDIGVNFITLHITSNLGYFNFLTTLVSSFRDEISNSGCCSALLFVP